MAKKIERTAEIFEESERIASIFAERVSAVQRDISVDLLLPNRRNPRQEYSKDALDELIQSIEEHGFIGALDGRELPDGRVELAYGSRRLLAAKAAGAQSIPVFLHDWDDNQLLFISLVENLIREDLTPYEEAETVGQMHETLGFSVRELSRKLGKSKSWVEDRLALYNAPRDVKEMVAARPDAARAGRFIARLPDEESRRVLEQSVLDQEATTHQVHQAVQQVLDQGLPVEEALAAVTAPPPVAPAAEPSLQPSEPVLAFTEVNPDESTDEEVEGTQEAAPGGGATSEVATRKERTPLSSSQLLLRANQALDRFDLEAVQEGELNEFLNQLEQIVSRATFLVEQLKERLGRGGETTGA
jgi:ParB/RepB/Spo0J family partition protein